MTLRIKKTAIAQLLGAVVVLAAGKAQAYDGTINFTGAIKAQTCTVEAAGGQIPVQLPNVQTGSLTKAGDTAGKSLIKIQLKGCDPAEGGNVRASFEPGGTVDPKTGKLLNTSTGASGAKGIEIELLNKDDSVIFIGDPSTSKGEDIGSAQTATLVYYAQYYAAASPVTAGDVKSQVTFSLVYE